MASPIETAPGLNVVVKHSSPSGRMDPGLWRLSSGFGGVGPRAKLKRKEGRLVDALAPRGDEGRGTLRKAMGSREQALIHGSPNGETRPLWVIFH